MLGPYLLELAFALLAAVYRPQRRLFFYVDGSKSDKARTTRAAKKWGRSAIAMTPVRDIILKSDFSSSNT